MLGSEKPYAKKIVLWSAINLPVRLVSAVCY